jgi:hypothetical protein
MIQQDLAHPVEARLEVVAPAWLTGWISSELFVTSLAIDLSSYGEDGAKPELSHLAGGRGRFVECSRACSRFALQPLGRRHAISESRNVAMRSIWCGSQILLPFPMREGSVEALYSRYACGAI